MWGVWRNEGRNWEVPPKKEGMFGRQSKRILGPADGVNVGQRGLFAGCPFSIAKANAPGVSTGFRSSAEGFRKCSVLQAAAHRHLFAYFHFCKKGKSYKEHHSCSQIEGQGNWHTPEHLHPAERAEIKGAWSEDRKSVV